MLVFDLFMSLEGIHIDCDTLMAPPAVNVLYINAYFITIGGKSDDLLIKFNLRRILSCVISWSDVWFCFACFALSFILT